MNKLIKLILLGILIWLIPFVVAFLLWNYTTNTPKIAFAWFNAIMALSWAIGFSIAALIYFKKVNQNKDKLDPVKESIIAGITWYLILLIMDLIVLVFGFKMSIFDYYPMLVTYLNTLIISIVIGFIIKSKK